MTLSDVTLTDLLAELRERLRHFVAEPPQRPIAPPSPGPLGPAGRAALAARLLAVMLAGHHSELATAAAEAIKELAEVLAAAPAPLPGSAMEQGLHRLARDLEELALAWEAGEARDLTAAWTALRESGDQLIAAAGAALPAAPAAAAQPAAGPPTATPAVWLLVAGELRRRTLRRRLEAAGVAVECPANASAVAARLACERPVAVLCDDAVPARHHSRLQQLLPRAELPMIVIRGSAGKVGAQDAIWAPPFRADDLLAQLRRHASDRSQPSQAE
ncbi:MAG: hypothetical protein RBT60_07695 [Candidatus Krumholzibacteria bacterium]|jgi:hypothetical protein|nr:hypothetical protein [Candidatus Krumholzibacteria bacterium]